MPERRLLERKRHTSCTGRRLSKKAKERSPEMDALWYLREGGGARDHGILRAGRRYPGRGPRVHRRGDRVGGWDRLQGRDRRGVARLVPCGGVVRRLRGHPVQSRGLDKPWRKRGGGWGKRCTSDISTSHTCISAQVQETEPKAFVQR